MGRQRNRYERRKPVGALRSLPTGMDNLSVLTVGDVGVSAWWMALAHLWLKTVLKGCLEGETPDLGLWPQLAITGQESPDGLRLLMYAFVVHQLGRKPPTSPVPEGAATVAALQFISAGGTPHLRVNGGIRGVLWAKLAGERLLVGWELPIDERERASHITVLKGHIEEQSAALVFWDLGPSFQRLFKDEHLLDMVQPSIGVADARMRWSQVAKRIDAAEVRSTLWLAAQDGVPADGLGTYMLDNLDDRTVREREVPLDDLATRARSAAKPGLRAEELVDRALARAPTGASFPNPPPSPEEEVERQLDAEANRAELEAIEAIADPDEKRLLALLRSEWREDSARTRSEVARRHGLDPSVLEAVLKRLRRKLGKST
jgi:hypothetical protein